MYVVINFQKKNVQHVVMEFNRIIKNTVTNINAKTNWIMISKEELKDNDISDYISKIIIKIFIYITN